MWPHRPISALLHAGVDRGSCCLLAFLVSACASVSPGGSRTALMEAGRSEASVRELRTTQNVLAVQLPGTLEAAADTMAVRATEVSLRRRALLFKIELVPAFYEALFNPDPLAALLDVWALSIQLVQFLETGAQGDALGPFQALGVEAARTVQRKIEVAVRAVARSPQGFERAESVVVKWAEAHPIEGPFSARPSILPELAKLSQDSADISVFQAVGDITGTVNDIAARLDIYAAYLPKAGRWQAELLVDDLMDRTEAQRVLATLRTVKALTERTNELLTAEALKAALAVAAGELRQERLAALASVDEQRKQTLTYLTSEREAGVAALDAQRRDVMAEMDRQRMSFLGELDALKKQSLLEVDDLASRLIRKGAFAMAALLFFAFALTLAVLRFAQRPKPVQGSQ